MRRRAEIYFRKGSRVASFAPVIPGFAGDERIIRDPQVKPSKERQYDKYNTKNPNPLRVRASVGARLGEPQHIRSSGRDGLDGAFHC